MPSIHIDDATVHGLTANASALGLDLEEYLRVLATTQPSMAAPNRVRATSGLIGWTGDAATIERVALDRELTSDLSVEEFERELAALTFSGPTLPDDFSRDDIYAGHD